MTRKLSIPALPEPHRLILFPPQIPEVASGAAVMGATLGDDLGRAGDTDLDAIAEHVAVEGLSIGLDNVKIDVGGPAFVFERQAN
jgi:hypothetical protein